MKKSYDKQYSQRGMASFMVTTVLIMVIGLIIVGFSQVARRNQREALDRQLSTQAFYAAESGVNAAVSSMKAYMATATLPPAKSECKPNGDYPAAGNLDGENVKVTCVLISTEIDSLYYSAVTESSPTVVPLFAANGAKIKQITLTWRSKNGGATPSVNCSGNGFTTRTNWACGNGVLRSDLSLTPTGRIETAMSTFFDPVRVPTQVDEASAPQVNFNTRGGLVRGKCYDGTDPKCMATITGLDASTYYMNLRSIYRDSSVTITGQDQAGNSVKFIGQALIDVTARAQDVLRRIQVRVPLESRESSNIPGYAIQTSDSICKRFSVHGVTATSPVGYYLDDPACN